MPSKFGPDVTGLSPIDTSAASFVQRGVVDTSGAEQIKMLGGFVQEQIAAYEGSQVEAGTEQLVRDYFTQAELEGSIAGQHQVVDMMSQQTEGLLSPEEDTALEAAKADMQRLRGAYAEGGGRISELELKARVETLTKNHINRFPGLADRFRGIATNELGDYASRIKMIEGARAAEAKQGSDMMEWAQKEAVKQGINPFTDVDWFPKMLKNNNDSQITQVTKNLRDRGQIRKEMVLNDPDAWIPVTRSTVRGFQTQMNEVIQSGAPLAEQLMGLERIAATIQTDIAQWNPPGSSDPKVGNFLKVITDMKESYRGLITGKTPADAAQAKLDGHLATVELGLLNDPDVGGVLLANKLFDKTLPQLIASDLGIKPYITAVQRVIKGDYPFPVVYSQAETKSRDQNVKSFFSTLKSQFGIATKDKDINASDVKIVNDSISSLLDGIHKEKSSAAYDGLVDLIADENFVEYQSKFVPVDLTGKMSGPINTYITDSVMEAFTGKFDPTTMTLTATQDGRLVVTTTNPEAQRDVSIINRDYMPRFTKYVKASVHLQGSKNYQDAATKFGFILNEVGRVSKDQGETSSKKINILMPAPKGRENEYIVVKDLIANYTVDPLGAWINNFVASSAYVGKELRDVPLKMVYGPTGKPKEESE